MNRHLIPTCFAAVAALSALAPEATADILPPPKGGYFAHVSPSESARKTTPPGPAATKPQPAPAAASDHPLETLFSWRQAEKEERDALHPSMLLVAFMPVCCFESEDGAIAGRVDWLPTHRIANWDPDHAESRGDFDDPLALFRVAIYDAPIRPLQKPKTVFYATRRVEGANGTHTFVDVTWGQALHVAVARKIPPGKTISEWVPSDGADVSIEWKRYSAAGPETGKIDESHTCRLARWKDLLHSAAVPDDRDF